MNGLTPEKYLLTPEEIVRATYQRNLLFGEDAAMAYTRKPDADQCIADTATAKDPILADLEKVGMVRKCFKQSLVAP